MVFQKSINEEERAEDIGVSEQKKMEMRQTRTFSVAIQG